MSCIRPIVAAFAALAVLTTGAPTARAATPGAATPGAATPGAITPGFPYTTPFAGPGAHSGGVVGTGGACGTSAGSDVGSWSGTTDIVCVAPGGMSFIGPAVGQVAAVIGPTIIGPVSIGKSVVSGGNVVGS
jgi:hypothetical protein